MEESQVVTPETVTEAPVQDVETVDSGTPETVAETDEDKQKREIAENQKKVAEGRRGLQRRFGELTSTIKQQQEIIKNLSLQRQPEQPQAQQDTPPAREQFQTYEDYVEARSAYKAEKAAEAKLLGMLQEAQRVQQQTTQQTAERDIDAQYAKNVSEFAAKTPDFQEVVDRDDVQIPDEAIRVIKRLPDAGPVLYAIGKNPELVNSLWQHRGDPVMQTYLLTQIAASSKSSPQISKAPAAGKPVGAKSSAGSEPPENPDAYMAWRKKNLR